MLKCFQNIKTFNHNLKALITIFSYWADIHKDAATRGRNKSPFTNRIKIDLYSIATGARSEHVAALELSQ